MEKRFYQILAGILLSAISCKCQPRLGDSIMEYKVIKKEMPMSILVNPSQFEKAYEVIVDSITYIVTLSDKNLINRISTADNKFKTPDGFKVNDAYSEIAKKIPDQKVTDYRGWGKFIRLPSGWNAVFDYKEQINSNSKIQFFFKK